MTALLVAAGAAVGAPLRYWVASRLDGRWPIGTLAVNVAGAALLGVLLGLRDVPAPVLALVGTGFCGTLTTFSTLGLDVVRLVEERAVARAAAYLAATVVLGLGAATAGWLLAG